MNRYHLFRINRFGVYSTFSFLLLEDRCDPKVVVLPVPVPVYVPVPMNMYSQYTPQPVGLPLLVSKTHL